ncbi:hypothetical protein GCM10011391_28380 [Pullulanibacillus camelliae]|uniref:YqaJ viral recombinase domain-containing protein n=1 Tax=Pullulanibacillus camelliae TaxID=1707096 RepID=A0A8J2YK44_9BACL|nr:YqaJ viral recombinase family protein [Pullulanibacillus camelliae]GGE47921.1 hypothetical protein GCM10011391_28380 [Pullulanibacillus camelliae]
MPESAIVFTPTSDLNHQEWLKARKKGIGGSDVGAILGLNKWRSPIQVYMDKIGEAPAVPENEAMYFGNILEEVVAREFSKRTGKKVRNRNAILQHPDYPWMLANVDRLIVGEKVGLECKTASEYMKDEWEGDEVPTSYLLQCQHYMAVTGYEAWWIAVLIGGNKFRYKKIERDEEIIQMLIEAEEEFWNAHVVPRIPPEIDGSEASEKLLKSMYPESEPDSETELPDEADKLIEALEQVKTEIDEREALKKEYENKLKQMLGEFETGLASNHVIRWKTYVSNRIDTKRLKAEQPDIYERYIKPSKSRRFTIKEAK